MKTSIQLPAIAYQVSFLKYHWIQQREYRLEMYLEVVTQIHSQTILYTLREFVEFVEHDSQSPIWRGFWIEQGRLAYIIASLRLMYHFSSLDCGDMIWRLRRIIVDDSE